jgi:hypothetical protein
LGLLGCVCVSVLPKAEAALLLLLCRLLLDVPDDRTPRLAEEIWELRHFPAGTAPAEVFEWAPGLAAASAVRAPLLLVVLFATDTSAQYTAAILGLPGASAPDSVLIMSLSKPLRPPGFDLLDLLLVLEGRLPGAVACCFGLDGRLPLLLPLPAVLLSFFRGLLGRLVVAAAAAANSLLLDCRLLPPWLLLPPPLLLLLLVMLRPNAHLPAVGEGGAAVVLIAAATVWDTADGLDSPA